MRRGSGVRIGTATALAVSALVLLPARASLAQAPACRPWNGEPNPLPSTASKNDFDARWATLRASELERLAKAIETQQPGLAHSVWSHVRCLDPENTRAQERLQALRPQIAYGTRPFVIRPKPAVAQPQMPKPPLDLEPVDRALAQAESELGEARFARAIEITEQTRRELADAADSEGLRERRARLEVIAATALVALGRSEDASESAARALRADPALVLDPNRTPPKIRRLFAQERERLGTVR
jgi:hypothetical protein